MKEKALLELLKKFDCSYQLHNHTPVFTVDEAQHLTQNIPGAHSKNLFLKDKKNNFFLVSVIENKKVDLKSLSKLYGKGGLSFANESMLLEKLKLTPGSVTPFGLIHDPLSEIFFIFDEDFLHFEWVNFHPLRNDMTISLTLPHFFQFFQFINHPVHIAKIPLLNL